MCEKKLFLSLVVWVSLSMLLASLEICLSLQERKEHAMGSCSYSAQWCVELVYDWAKVCRGLSDLQYRYVSKEETPV